MRRWRFPSLLLLLQIGGCAYIDTLSLDPAQRMDRLIEQKEYGRALALAEGLAPTHPNHAVLQAKTKSLAPVIRQFEQDTLARARREAAAGRIAEALRIVDDALDRLPNSTKLQQGRDELWQRRALLTEELQLQLLLRRGEWLAAAVPVQRRLSDLNPDEWRPRRMLRNRETESEEVGRELLAHGLQALQRGKLNEARETLALAQRLHETPEGAEALASLQKEQRKHQRKARKAQEQVQQEKREKELAKLLEEYQAAQAADDYPTCQRLMKRIEPLAGEEEVEVRRLRRELDLAVAVRLTQYLDEASSAYARGQFEDALARWHKALELDPENEQVKEHIKRAERVLDKLRLLREKQGGG